MNLKILIALILSTTLINQVFCQDTAYNKDKKFKDKIESIVKNVFKQIEEELGENIYDEENPAENDIDSDIQPENEPEEDYSPFTPLIGKRIPRNNSTVFISSNYNDKFLLRYNRVEGLFLGFQSPHKYFWDKERKVTLSGSIGYGFGVHRWEFDAGLAHQLSFDGKILEIGAEGYNTVNSPDHWLIADLENSLSALFFKYDYKDYFLRKGYSGWLGLYQKSKIADLQVKISFMNDMYSSLPKNVNWSLFRNRKQFRENPFISEGNVKGLSFTISFHKLDNLRKNLSGWSASLSAEIAGKLFKGDYDFNRYLLDLRRYQKLSRYDNFNIRLRAATSEGQLPMQYLCGIGGISTMPAYRYKEFVGNRLLLANIEYIVKGSALTEASTFPFSLVERFNLILFYDAGYINQVSENESFNRGFNNLKVNSLISDVGMGIGTKDGNFRLSFAWRTDRKAPANIFIRVSRPF